MRGEEAEVPMKDKDSDKKWMEPWSRMEHGQFQIWNADHHVAYHCLFDVQCSMFIYDLNTFMDSKGAQEPTGSEQLSSSCSTSESIRSVLVPAASFADVLGELGKCDSQ